MKPHLLIAQVDCDSEIALASHYKSPITSDLRTFIIRPYMFLKIFFAVMQYKAPFLL